MKDTQMTETDDNPVTSWNNRIANLRQSSASAFIGSPAVEIDVRIERPPPPERLSEPEKALWRQLIESRRPGWFSGGLEILETYVVTALQVRQIEEELRTLRPSTDPNYQRLARLHRQCVAQASLLATRLRLTPGSRIAKTQPQVGDMPMA